MLQQKKPKDYVLATGKTYTVKEFVNIAFKIKGFELSWHGIGKEEKAIDQNGITRVIIDEKYYRPCEVDILLGDPSLAEKELKWKRQFNTLELLIENMFLE